MEAGALFLLVLLVLVLAGVGFAVYVIAARLRQRQLHPEEDKVEGGEQVGGAGRDGHPEHVRPGRAQRARFLPDR